MARRLSVATSKEQAAISEASSGASLTYSLELKAAMAKALDQEEMVAALKLQVVRSWSKGLGT